MKRVLRICAALVLTAVAIYLPFRPEWHQYRKAVYAEHVAHARPGQTVSWGDIQWRLIGYGPAVLKPGDLPPSGLPTPLRSGESLVVVTLEARPLTRKNPDFKIAYELRDSAGHHWQADDWHSFFFYGQQNRIQVMGTVPQWAVSRYSLVLRQKRPDLDQLIGGRMLVFGR